MEEEIELLLSSGTRAIVPISQAIRMLGAVRQSNPALDRPDPTDRSVGTGGPRQPIEGPSPARHVIAPYRDDLGPPRARQYEAAFATGGPDFPPGGSSCPTGYNPALAPESYLGRGCDNPKYICDKGRLLPPWTATSEGATLAAVVNDYTSVGTVGAMRAAFESLYSLGEFTQTRFVGAAAGEDNVAVVNERVLALGVRLDWGVSLLNWAPFDLQIVTDGFETVFSAQDADRDVTVRVSGNNGGSIYLPFARRPNGVSQAQPTLARAEADNATVTVNGIPAAIGSAFGFSVQLIVAYHPITAAFGTSLGLF